MKIGFDLDEIFVSHPPFIPTSLIIKLYGEKVNGKLTYRIPGTFEQYVRRLSHIWLLRPPLQQNIDLLRKKSKESKNYFVLISSRYGFLEGATKKIMRMYNLEHTFQKKYFNFTNMQPHLFKDAALHKEKLDRFVDDDLPLLQFLAKRHTKVIFFWLNNRNSGKLEENLYAITNLSEVFKKL